MRPKVTLEQHLKDCWHRATFALGYLDARSPESTQIDFVEGYLEAIQHLRTVLPDFRESEANALSEDLHPSCLSPL